MSDTNVLPDHIHVEISRLCAEGDTHAKSRSLQAALACYDKALALIPGDKSQWEAATWIYAAKGDALFDSRQWQPALKNFASAVACPGGFGNPFIHLRLGQCSFEVGDRKRAADELTRAYALDGEALFAADGAKYLTFLKTQILPEPKRQTAWWPFSS